MPDQIISQEGYEKLQQELNQLITVKRKEIAERIEKAKELGDLSENAEYTEAKDAQALNEGRVAELSATLKNVTVVNHKGNSKGHIVMGSKVLVEVNGEKKEYTIVSFNETHPAEGKISNESPLGTAFIGKVLGEEVLVETPRGEVKYKILKIE